MRNIDPALVGLHVRREGEKSENELTIHGLYAMV